jgi:oligopeptide transport system permease protein
VVQSDGRAENDWGDLWLPAIVLGVSLYATSMRLMRGSVIDTLNQDWVRTAYSKGLPRRASSPCTCCATPHPGDHELRDELRRAARRRDRHRGHLQRPRRRQHAVPRDAEARGPTIVSFVTVFVIIYVLVNLLVDLLYGLLDPRIRYV